MVKIELRQIGIIHSPYKERGDAPRQGMLSREEAWLEIFPEFLEGLLGLEETGKIVVIYWGDRADRDILQSKPHGISEKRGVFASRSPNRPNPLALCVCEIKEISGNKFKVTGLDALDGSPLLDIKIHSVEVDCYGKADDNPME